MSEPTFSKEQIAALEQILGVKLPEQGFTLEIKPIVSAELEDAQLEGVSGGIVTPSSVVKVPSVRGAVVPIDRPPPPQLRWRG